MTKHEESFTGIGVVEIRPFRLVNGEKEYFQDSFSKHNLIVQNGRETLLDLLLGVRKKHLKFIRWGKGGAPSFPEGDPLSPYEVGDADTDVDTLLLDKPLSAHNRLSPTTVEFVETLISDEVNDDVNEAAMMFEDAESKDRSIFARITFPTARLTVEKGTGIEIQWVFNFRSVREAINE